MVFSLAITDAFRLVIVFFETRLDFAKRYILRVGFFPTTSGFAADRVLDFRMLAYDRV